MNPTRSCTVASVILTIASIVGCHRAPLDEPAQVIDSAGVRLVTMPDPEAAAPRWRALVDSPLVVLGGQNEATGRFDEPTSAVVFPDGRIVVAVDGEFRIHVFDSFGLRIAEFGRRGQGPEEFDRVPKLFVHADSLITVHERRGQLGIGVWNARWELVRAWQSRVLGSYDSWSGAIGLASDGSVLVMTSVTVPSTGARRGPHRAEVTIHRATAGGGDAQPILQLQGDERYGLSGDNGVGDTFVQFGKLTTVAISNGLIRSGTNDGFQIDTWSAGGRLVRSLRIRAQPQRVTNEMREQWARDELENTSPENRRLTELVQSTIRFADQLRFYDELYPVEGGGLWIERARLNDRDPRRFLVLSDSDQVLGSITLAPEVRPYWIGEGRLLLQALDSNDVPFIGLYRIVQ